MKYVEVRCCCEPMKLLGYLPVPDRTPIAPGVSVKFLLPPRAASSLRSASWRLFERPEILTLTITPYGRGDMSEGLAFKSDDTPIETLRRIPNFLEAPVLAFRACFPVKVSR